MEPQKKLNRKPAKTSNLELEFELRLRKRGGKSTINARNFVNEKETEGTKKMQKKLEHRLRKRNEKSHSNSTCNTRNVKNKKINQKQKKKLREPELELELTTNSQFPKFQSISTIALETSKAKFFFLISHVYGKK